MHTKFAEIVDCVVGSIYYKTDSEKQSITRTIKTRKLVPKPH